MVSAGWLWEMRSAIVARVRDRNPMEVANDLGHRFGDYFRMADLLAQNGSFLAFHTANLDSWLLAQNLVSVLRRTGSADSAENSRSSCAERPGCSKAAKWTPFFSSLSPLRRAFGRRLLQRRTP